MTTQRIPKSKLAVWNVQEELSLRKLAETAFESVALEDLTDVDIASPQDGEVLRYDNSLGVWINDTPGGGSVALDDLTDVVISTPTNGQVLTYDSGTSTWVNDDVATGATTLDGLTDVVITTPANDQILRYDSGTSTWVNSDEASGGGTPAGTTGQVQYNNAGAFAADAGFTYDASTNVLFTANGFSFVNSGVGDSIFKPTTKSIGARNGSEITTLYTANGSYSSIHLLARDSSLAESSEIILELRSDSDNNIARIRLDDQEPAPIFSTTFGGAGGTEYYLLHENNVKTVKGEDIYGAGGNITFSDTDVPATVVTESGTSRAMANSDAGTYIRFTNTAAKTATFGTGVNVVGQEFHIRNVGTNDLTLTPSSTTLNAPAGGTLVVPPGGTVTVKQVASTEFDVFGTTNAA